MSENDMAKIARLVADPHAEIDRAEHVAAIAEFNEKAALARVAQLEAALEFEHEETKRLREIIMPLRDRVEKLEAALRDCKRYAEDHDDEWVPFRVVNALNDAPQ